MNDFLSGIRIMLVACVLILGLLVFGLRAGAVQSSDRPTPDLVRVHVPPGWFMGTWISNDTKRPVSEFVCNRAMKEPLMKALHCVYRYQMTNKRQVLHRFSGCYSPRKIFGTDRWSKHAYGMAVDLNYFPETGKTKVEMPVVKCFEKEGFIWGGRWKNKPDSMHFELRR